MKTGKIFASAGCGKTTALLERLDKVFQGGHKPQEVLFTTFTRSGAYEARERAIKRFSFDPDAFPYFRTLHSICYRAIVAPKIMSRLDYINLGKELRCRFGSAGLGEELYEKGKGDALLSLYNLQRNMMAQENLIPQEYGVYLSQEEYDHFIRTYNQYRNYRGLYDYTDLLEDIVHEGREGSFVGLPVRFAFVDEAQDLTRLQAEVVQQLIKQAEEVWFAGDDDQCIFSYSGADPDILISLEAKERVILDKSYRLPVPVADYANEVAERIQYREQKHIQSFYTEKNEKTRIRRSVNFMEDIHPEEPTTILCRNRVFFGYFEENLRQRGLLYTFVRSTDAEEVLDPHDMGQIRRAILTWEGMLAEPDRTFPATDIEVLLQYVPVLLMPKAARSVVTQAQKGAKLSYNQLTRDHRLLAQHGWQKTLSKIPYELAMYMEVLEKQGKLDHEPHIQIGTIHSFKGKEDDHVIVLPDMSWQTWKNYNDNPDSEHRVFYVAVTRARERLTLLEAVTKYHYNW